LRRVTIAFGFLSRATTWISAFAYLAAAKALLINGPRPAPKYITTIGSFYADDISISFYAGGLSGLLVCKNFPYFNLS
jgi:hypothetical protein